MWGRFSFFFSRIHWFFTRIELSSAKRENENQLTKSTTTWTKLLLNLFIGLDLLAARTVNWCYMVMLVISSRLFYSSRCLLRNLSRTPELVTSPDIVFAALFIEVAFPLVSKFYILLISIGGTGYIENVLNILIPTTGLTIRLIIEYDWNFEVYFLSGYFCSSWKKSIRCLWAQTASAKYRLGCLYP